MVVFVVGDALAAILESPAAVLLYAAIAVTSSQLLSWLLLLLWRWSHGDEWVLMVCLFYTVSFEC